MGPAHDQRIQLADPFDGLVAVGQLVKDVAHGVEAGALLAVALDDRPGAVGRVRLEEHRFLGAGVFIPLVQRRLVDGAQLPLLERVGGAFAEAAALFLLADAEPELHQVDAAAHQVALELGRLLHELLVFLRGAEAHHALHARPVVPAAVKEHDLAVRGQMLDVALEVPLTAFGVGGFLQCHHPGAPRVQVLHETLDGAALAGRIASLEQDDDALAGFLGPGLQLQQLHLQTEFLLLVGGAAHQVLVRIRAVTPVIGQLLVGVGQRVHQLLGHLALEGLADDLPVVGCGTLQDGAQSFGALLHGLLVDVVEDGTDGLDLFFLRGLDLLAGHEFFQGLFLQAGRRIALGHAADFGGQRPCRSRLAPARGGRGGGFGGAAARTCLGCAFGRCCDGRAVRGLGAVRGGRLGGTGSVLHAGGSLVVQKE